MLLVLLAEQVVAMIESSSCAEPTNSVSISPLGEVVKLYLARSGAGSLSLSLRFHKYLYCSFLRNFDHKTHQLPASFSTVALFDIDDLVSRIAALLTRLCRRPRARRRGAPSATSPVSTITTPTGRRRSSTVVAAVRASGTTSKMEPWMGKALVWTFWSVEEERELVVRGGMMMDIIAGEGCEMARAGCVGC